VTETTEIKVYIFDARWQQKLHELYTQSKLTSTWSSPLATTAWLRTAYM
jgi:hypothetical protein